MDNFIELKIDILVNKTVTLADAPITLDHHLPMNTFFTVSGQCPLGESRPPSMARPRPQLSL